MAAPTVQSRSSQASSTSNATSWDPTANFLDADVNVGDRIYVFLTADGNPTLSTAAAGWNKVGQISEAGGAVTHALFYFESADGAAIPIPQFDSTASEQYSAVYIHVRPGAGNTLSHLTIGTSQGSSTNSDPASITNNSGGSLDLLVICSRGGDSTTTASAAPTNYSNLQTRAGGGTNGASTNTADRTVTIANSGTEDPGVFTSSSEQWACITVGIYEIPGGSTLSGSGTGAASIAGGSISAQVPSLAGVGAMSPAGQAIAAATFSGSGAGSLSGNGGYLASSVFSGAGVGAHSVTALMLATTTLSGAGIGASSPAGQSTATATQISSDAAALTPNR